MTPLAGEFVGVALASVVLAAVTVLRPRWGLAAVLASLPFFAHQVINAWAFRLFVFLAVFEIAYLIQMRARWRELARATEHPVLFLCALYTAASFLSLSSLLPAALLKHWTVIMGLGAADWPQYIFTTLTLPERSREYSCLSAVRTLQAFVVGLIVWREARRSETNRVWIASAIAAGTALFVLLGLFEYWGLCDLSKWRGADGVYRSQGFPRLQSVSGNPGWFAEYVVFAAPFWAIVLWGDVRRYSWLRIGGFSAAIAVGALAVALAFQRGGWVAYPAVVALLLVGIVRTAYLTPKDGDRNGHFGRRLRRVALAVGVVVLVFATGFWVSLHFEKSLDVREKLSGYRIRLESMADVSDRLKLSHVGFLIGVLHPVLGAGSESFTLRYMQYFQSPEGRYFDRKSLRPEYPSSAHNVYMQTFAGKGIVGLTLLLGICVGALWSSAQVLRRAPRRDAPSVLFTLMASVSILGVLGYGIVQEVFYIQSLQVMFFVALGLAAATTESIVRWRSRVRRALWYALAVAFVLHLTYQYGYPGPNRLIGYSVPIGLISEEADVGGFTYFWTAERVTLPIPPRAWAFYFNARSVAPYPQRVELTVCGRQADQFLLENQNWREVFCLLSRNRDCERLPAVQLKVVPPWQPAGDDRVLGIMIRDIRFPSR